jgi:tripartite-type tricarboxylate transporter receptor subunit TctC
MKVIKPVVLFVLLSFVFGYTTAAFSDEFPKRPIRMVIPFSAGGALEILARSFQKTMEKELGTKIIIECIPGGSTKVGTMELMKAKPDGYTLIFMSAQSWVNLYYPKTYESKMWEIFTPVGTLTAEPTGFVGVRVESSYKTWADLAKAVKENPGKLTCGGTSAGGTHEIMKNEILKETKFVPFAGAAPMNTALLGGHVDFQICTPMDAAPMIFGGKTRGLAVSSDKRMKALPDVPTFIELGIGESLTFKRSIWAPARTPSPVVDKITKAIEKVTEDPEFIKFAETQMLCKVEYRTPEKTKEDTVNYDKIYGPKLAAMNKP